MSSQRFGIVVFMLLGVFGTLDAQRAERGIVSYVSSENVYVRFSSTEGIRVLDTLFFNRLPALQVVKKSSISTINRRIGKMELNLGDTLYVYVIDEEKPNLDTIKRDGTNQIIRFADTITQRIQSKKKEQKSWEWDGLLGLSSRYNQTFLSEANRSLTRQFLRFSVSGKSNDAKIPLNVNLMGNYQHFNSAFSEREYPKLGRLNIFQANIDYDINANLAVQVGRSFQTGLSSVGALDAANIRFKSGGFQIETVAGFSPDLSNYAPSFERPVYGVNAQFAKFEKDLKWHLGLGWFDQQFKGVLDRRLWIGQGSIYLPKGNLYFLLEGDATNGFSQHRMQSVFVSGRLRITPKWSIFSSYDTRLPWIFWSSFDRLSIDALMERESQQGWRTRITLKSGKYTSWGFHATLRQRQNTSQMLLGGFSVDQRKLFWKGSSLSYRMNAADYGVWQNVQQFVRLRQTFKAWDISAFYRSVLFARRYTIGSLFNQSYVGVQSSIPLKNRYELDAFVEYDFQQQQQQLLIYLTLNKRF